MSAVLAGLAPVVDSNTRLIVLGSFPGVASLQAHDVYLRGLGSADFDAEEFLDGLCRPAGTRLGVRHAAPFEVFSLRSW